jgi:dTDP-4-amino-4,6-dideoxygalactose transaminase
MNRIPIYKLQSNYRTRIYNSGKWIDGPKTKELEERLKEYLGVKYVVLTNSGTSALLAAYWVLKNEFSTLFADPYTFPATYQPARLLGYEVNFVKTMLNDKFAFPKKGLSIITHLFGQPNRLLSKTNNISFIEDACQSFGSELNGKKIGTFGKLGCFSFYPTKMLHTCGHGGAVVVNEEKYYKAVKIFVESGRTDGKMTEKIALNLRLDEIKAEFLLYELDNYEDKIKQQRDIAKEFIRLIPPPQPFLEEKDKERHIYSIFNLCLKERDRFRSYMDRLGIETLIYYGDDILPEQERPKYKDLTSAIVAIPCRWNLTANEIKRIKEALKGWFK